MGKLIMGAYKITCLSLIEKEYKAKMTPCGAWHLAKNFPGGATAEERHTRTYCSVFNRCHTSRMRVVGKGVVEEISRLISDGTEYPADSAVCCKSGNTWYTMLVMAEDDVLLLAESSEKIQELLDKAEKLLDEHPKKDGYYAFVCEKCASVFGYYGRFVFEGELRERARRIYEGA